MVWLVIVGAPYEFLCTRCVCFYMFRMSSQPDADYKTNYKYEYQFNKKTDPILSPYVPSILCRLYYTSTGIYYISYVLRGKK